MYDKSNPQINQKRNSKSNLKQTKPHKIIKLKSPTQMQTDNHTLIIQIPPHSNENRRICINKITKTNFCEECQIPQQLRDRYDQQSHWHT